jgi:hypothetical protein
MGRLVLLVVVSAVASCKPMSVRHAPSPVGRLLSDLSVFALGHPLPPEELARDERAVLAGSLMVERFIDQILERPMGGRLAQDIVMGGGSVAKDNHPVPAQAILRSYREKTEGRIIYYLRTKCSRVEAESVVPWWSPGTEVLVCPSSYRPRVRGDDAGRTCGAEMLSPRDVDVCGCGPWLMFCNANHEQWQKVRERVQREVSDTVGYVVDRGLPIEKLFTMNETVRTKDAELLYRRSRVLAGEDASKLFPITGYGEDEGELSARVEQVPNQHAGLLSTPALTYSSDALRGVMRNYYDWLWCTGVQSAHVTTDAVLGLDVVDLRVGGGWKKLASMKICTDCHARLDYGMQFFQGYPSATAGVDFRPNESLRGRGPLYRRDIEDPLGSADLTPRGFAELATAAPEFGDCMARRVVDHVFGGANTTADYAAVRDTFAQSHRIKDMMRTAMIRFAHAALDREVPPPRDARLANDARPGDANGRVALSPELVRMVRNDCRECHDEGADLNLLAPELDKGTLALMIDRVGFGAMPKNSQGLGEAEREALVAEIARHLYAADEDRTVATDYFAYGLRGLPVHRFASAVGLVGAAAFGPRKAEMTSNENGARARAFRPEAVEPALRLLTYSPGVGMFTAVSAMRTCKAAGLAGTELAECIDAASAPENVTIGGGIAKLRQ